MKRLTNKNIKRGDVFSFVVAEGYSSVGVVVRSNIELYICVFREMVASTRLLALEIEELTPFLAGRTSDEKFFHGEWGLIGKSDYVPDVPFPCYVVETPDGLCLKDFDGNPLRPASQAERDFFGGMKTFSNVAFEKAIKSVHDIDFIGYDYSKISIEEAWRRVVDSAGHGFTA